MKINTNSNAYTIIYASVMVIIVAFILAFTSSSLKDIQEKNVELDKMKQILNALHVDWKGQDAQALYEKYVKKDQIIDASGNVVAENGGFHNVQSDDKLTVFVAEVDGETKYILPLNGNGLWGSIWGYIALDSDKNTVYGTFFSHAGETPGLGAEIATDGFQKPFEGKHIKKGNNVVSIAVVKPGKSVEGQDYVDGISGGTITSVAVQDMLMNNLKQYNNFLTK
jgi:NADH:ubiquinone oxidoreductase, Na(+)-translocating, C subunit